MGNNYISCMNCLNMVISKEKCHVE